MEKKRKIMCAVFVCFLMLQTLLFSFLVESAKLYQLSTSQVEEELAEAQRIFVDDFVREELRRKGVELKNYWLNYAQANQDLSYVKKQDGNVVYGNKDGGTIIYDSSTMYKVKTRGYYDIYDLETNNRILHHSRPLWNKDSINKTLELLIANNKNFGYNGSIYLVDSITGEILIQDSSVSIPPTKINGQDYYFIQDAWKSKDNKNIVELKNMLDKIMLKSDTRYSDKLVSLYKEKERMRDDVENFFKYPLGMYNRRFVEVIHIPEEMLGIEQTDMQLKLILTAEEKDIYAPFMSVGNNLKDTGYDMKRESQISFVFSAISILINITTIFFALFFVYKMIEDEKIKKNKV